MTTSGIVYQFFNDDENFGVTISEDVIEYWVLEDDPRSKLFHRDAGPAIIASESDYWFAHGELHRFDGPAVIHADEGVERVEFALNGRVVSEMEFRRLGGKWCP